MVSLNFLNENFYCVSEKPLLTALYSSSLFAMDKEIVKDRFIKLLKTSNL